MGEIREEQDQGSTYCLCHPGLGHPGVVQNLGPVLSSN